MRAMHVLLILLCVLSLSGCAYFDGVGYFHHSQELFEAKIDYNMLTTKAAIKVTSEDGLLCTGGSRTKFSTESRLSCMGAHGDFIMSCNDGRHLKAKWTSENCSVGQAIGIDQYGNTFVASFGEDRSEMLRRVGAGPSEPRPAYSRKRVSAAYASTFGHGDDYSVVVIDNASSVAAPPDNKREVQSVGLLVDDAGLLVTCATLVDARSVTLAFFQGEEPQIVKLVAVDRKSGIAVLQTSHFGHAVPIGLEGIVPYDEPIHLGALGNGSPLFNSQGEAVGLHCNGKNLSLESLPELLENIPLVSIRKGKNDNSVEALRKYYKTGVANLSIQPAPNSDL